MNIRELYVFAGANTTTGNIFKRQTLLLAFPSLRYVRGFGLYVSMYEFNSFSLYLFDQILIGKCAK